MDVEQVTTDGCEVAETAAERSARIAREDAIIARAEADIDAGRGIELDELVQWFHALERDPKTPRPVSRRTAAR